MGCLLHRQYPILRSAMLIFFKILKFLFCFNQLKSSLNLKGNPMISYWFKPKSFGNSVLGATFFYVLPPGSVGRSSTYFCGSGSRELKCPVSNGSGSRELKCYMLCVQWIRIRAMIIILAELFIIHLEYYTFKLLQKMS